MYIFVCSLVQKSPSISSRPESPLDFYDPTRETLLALLQKISEEAGSASVASVSPFATLKAPQQSNSRHPSPVASLSRQLAGILSNQNAADQQPTCSRAVTKRNIDINIEKTVQKTTNLASIRSTVVDESTKVTRASSPDIPVISITKTDSQRRQNNFIADTSDDNPPFRKLSEILIFNLFW